MDQFQQLSPAYNPPGDVNLKDVARAIWRRKWIVLFVTAACFGASIYYTAKAKRKYQAVAQLNVLTRQGNFLLDSTSAFTAPLVETTDSQSTMIMTDGMAKRTLDYLKNDALTKGLSREALGVDDDEKFRQDFTRLVRVDTPKDTDVVLVSAIGDSPTKAAILANAVCQAFVEWKKDIVNESTRSGVDDLRARAKKAHAEMLLAEQKQEEFKSRFHQVDIPAQQKATMDSYFARDAEVSTTAQDLATQQARLQGLQERKDQINKSLVAATEIPSPDNVLKLKTDLDTAEADLAKAQALFQPGMHTELDPLQARVDTLRAQLKRARAAAINPNIASITTQTSVNEDYKTTRIAVAGLQKRLAAATQRRDELKGQLDRYPKIAYEYNVLAQRLDQARALDGQLQTSLHSAEALRDRTPINVVFAQPAEAPLTPFKPNPVLNLGLGLVLGIFFSIGAVLLLEQSDRRLRDVESVKRLAPGPVIGLLPQMSRSQERAMIRGDAPSRIVEAISLARANLALALRHVHGPDPFHHQVIMITSAVPGEGKSMTSAQLARSLARADKSVVLVDADMRRPSQNRNFNTDEPHGLADVLTGKMTIEEALVTSDTPNLAILHAGVPKRNPTELVSLPQMEEVISALRNQCDVVIIDSPANSVVADALLIAPHVDCILHVIGAGQTHEDVVRDSIAALRAASPKTMVFFVNRAPRDRSHVYGSYYSYQMARNGRKNGSNGNGNGNGKALPVIEAMEEESAEMDSVA